MAASPSCPGRFPPNGALIRRITAEIRCMGTHYRHLEAVLPSMTEPQLQDLLLLMRDAKRDENQRCRSQAARMGLRGVIR